MTVWHNKEGCMNKKLPVVATFKEALLLPLKHFRSVLIVGFPIILVSAVYEILSYFWFIDGNRPDQPSSAYFVFMSVSALVYTVAYAVGIVGCHRLFLMDDTAETNVRLFNWTGNEIKFTGWWLVLGVVMLLASIPLMFVFFVMIGGVKVFAGFGLAAPVLGRLFMLPILYVMARCSLVLPSAAIGIHGKSISWSWKLSAGNGLRLAVLVSLVPLVLNTLFSLLPSEGLLWLLLGWLVSLVLGVIQIALLSLSYKFLVENVVVEEDENDEPAEALAAQESGAL